MANLVEKLGEYSPKKFFAGEFPVVREIGTAGEAISQYDLIMLAGADAARMDAATASVPGPGVQTCGKDVVDLISMGTYIDAQGKVHGEVYYVTGFEGFSNVEEEQSGNYFPVHLGSKYAGKEISVTNGDKAEKKATEVDWLIRVQQGKTVVFKDGGDTIMTLDFSEATLDTTVKASAKAKVIAAAAPVSAVPGEVNGPAVVLKATKAGIANVAGIAISDAAIGEPVIYILTGEVFADVVNTNDIDAAEAKAVLRKLSIFMK